MPTPGDFEFARPSIRSTDLVANFDPEVARRANNDVERHGANLSLATDFAGGRLRFLDIASFTARGEPGFDSGNGPTAGQRLRARSRSLSNLAQLRFERPSPTGWGDALELALFLSLIHI